MDETFKDIAGFKGLYQIGSKGTVKSLTFRNNRTTFEREKILSPTNNGNGYLIVSLNKNGKRKSAYIHRLVAEAFLPREKGKDVINHKDHNTRNNSVDNLEWCTQRENVRFSVDRMKHEKTKCKPTNTGEKYISRCISHKKYLCYRVTIKQKNICKYFKALDEAIKYRNEVMNDVPKMLFVRTLGNEL